MSDDCYKCGAGEYTSPPDGPSGGKAEPNGGRTQVDEIFDSLAHRRRRHCLYYLDGAGGATVDELAREVAAREAGVPPREVAGTHHERVATELVHTHLPKLADARFVEYDERSRTVRYGEPPVLLEKVLALLARLEGEASE